MIMVIAICNVLFNCEMDPHECFFLPEISTKFSSIIIEENSPGKNVRIPGYLELSSSGMGKLRHFEDEGITCLPVDSRFSESNVSNSKMLLECFGELRAVGDLHVCENDIPP